MDTCKKECKTDTCKIKVGQKDTIGGLITQTAQGALVFIEGTQSTAVLVNKKEWDDIAETVYTLYTETMRNIGINIDIYLAAEKYAVVDLVLQQTDVTVSSTEALLTLLELTRSAREHLFQYDNLLERAKQEFEKRSLTAAEKAAFDLCTNE